MHNLKAINSLSLFILFSSWVKKQFDNSTQVVKATEISVRIGDVVVATRHGHGDNKVDEKLFEVWAKEQDHNFSARRKHRDYIRQLHTIPQ